MSEYKRFVSYIYEYLDHQKGPNRGFLKVECRNGICQMNVSLRGICRDDNGTAKIYGFRRKDARLQGTLLAEGDVTSGTLSLQIRFPEGEIGTERYRMTELSGVILTDSEDLLYATQWDDDSLDFTGFPNIPPKEAAIHEEPVHDAEESDAGKFDTDVSDAEEFDDAKRSPDGTSCDEALPEPAAAVPAEISASSGEDVYEEDPLPDETLSGEALSDETSPDPETVFPEEETIPDEKNSENIQKQECAAEEELHAASCNAAEESLRPYFRDGRIVDCREISPQDICRLNPADWYLANNRFVLCGQQAFGHLLIGQLAESGQTVLCIPGVYHQQERALANMYGFSCFVPCPGHADRPQGFGYWYRLIHPADTDPSNR